MKKHSLVLASLFLFSISVFFTACKKINEATELGSDLIPPVDNVTTFDTTLSVETYNFLFENNEDTTTGGALQFLGNINNDPLFGKSEGIMYFDLMPITIKSPFPFKKSELVGLDSVVLVLGYSALYGDSLKPQQVQVFEIPASEIFLFTKDYRLTENAVTSLGAALSPVKTFTPANLNDSVYPRGERTANQLRIPLNNAFGQRLLNYDSLDAYASRTAFKKYFNGFAVVPQNNGTANALVGFNLTSVNTKLAFYVRYKNGDKTDTSMVSFALTDSTAIANYIKRDYSAAEVATAVTGTTQDDVLYIQSSPGSYAKINIPGLSGLTNRIVHSAELSFEQVFDPLSAIFTPPTSLYLDVFDQAKGKYGTIPGDVALTPTGANTKGDTASFTIGNPAQFGMFGRKIKNTNTGDSIYRWQFNITRYVQRIANGTEPARQLRLYSPFPVITALSNGVQQYISSNMPYVIGRVRIGGGNHPTQKMKLRLVYSKL